MHFNKYWTLYICGIISKPKFLICTFRHAKFEHEIHFWAKLTQFILHINSLKTMIRKTRWTPTCKVTVVTYQNLVTGTTTNGCSSTNVSLLHPRRCIKWKKVLFLYLMQLAANSTDTVISAGPRWTGKDHCISVSLHCNSMWHTTVGDYWLKNVNNSVVEMLGTMRSVRNDTTNAFLSHRISSSWFS